MKKIKKADMAVFKAVVRKNAALDAAARYNALYDAADRVDMAFVDGRATRADRRNAYQALTVAHVDAVNAGAHMGGDCRMHVRPIGGYDIRRMTIGRANDLGFYLK